jgi:hypothetical protein
MINPLYSRLFRRFAYVPTSVKEAPCIDWLLGGHSKRTISPFPTYTSVNVVVKTKVPEGCIVIVPTAAPP